MSKTLFVNSHVLITGGSSGIGLETAKLLAARGANITILARDERKLQNAQQEIESVWLNPTQKVLSFRADVTKREEVEYSIEQAVCEQGQLNYLVANAGVAHPDYFENLTIEDFERAMQVNYFGALYAVRAALPHLEKSAKSGQKAQVVLVSSGAGLIGVFGYAAYSPSKFALRGLGEVLRAEFKPKGIGVSVVYPPDTDTPQLREENQTKPPETKAISATAKTWSAQNVAKVLVRGIEKNQFVIAPGVEMALLARFHSLVAPVLHRYFDGLVNKTRRS